jgi:competence ComEA-like helix-hairpin-helix protein
MKHVPGFTLFTAATAVILTVALRAAPADPGAPAIAPQQDARHTSLPDSPETALYVRVCAHCHDLDRIELRRRTKSEWSNTIEQMVDDGAEASEEEFERILDVLLRNFGAVGINTAEAADLVKVLAVSTKDADAIVSYRTANGKFPDFEALRKVPGIDLTPLEQRKTSIRF